MSKGRNGGPVQQNGFLEDGTRGCSCVALAQSTPILPAPLASLPCLQAQASPSEPSASLHPTLSAPHPACTPGLPAVGPPDLPLPSGPRPGKQPLPLCQPACHSQSPPPQGLPEVGRGAVERQGAMQGQDLVPSCSRKVTLQLCQGCCEVGWTNARAEVWGQGPCTRLLRAGAQQRDPKAEARLLEVGAGCWRPVGQALRHGALPCPGSPPQGPC